MKIPEWTPDQYARLGKNTWAVGRLISLSKDFPVMEIPLDHLNIYNTYDKITLREFVMHMQAALNSDLNYPIILDEDGEILDGRHRVIKALFKGFRTIKAVRFDENPTPCRHED
jgi:hypothetical protein